VLYWVTPNGHWAGFDMLKGAQHGMKGRGPCLLDEGGEGQRLTYEQIRKMGLTGKLQLHKEHHHPPIKLQWFLNHSNVYVGVSGGNRF
jgi:hypothetical protein